MKDGAILIVDDDEEFLDYLRTALKPFGAPVEAAASGRAACGLLDRGGFKLVLTDLRLPDMTGLEVLAHARAKDALTVGILLTAHGSSDSATEALRDGAYDYLLKPCAPDVIEAAVRRGLEHFELKRSLMGKTAELDKLRQQLADKALLIQNVSHELKNPLTVVYGYSSFLLRQEAEDMPPEDLKRNLQSIHRNAERLGHLLEELLESTRLANRKIELHRARVSAGELAKEAVDNLRFQALQKEISVKLQLPDEDLTVLADPKRVHQILANLLGNALKFTPEGGEISVSVGRGEGFAVFCVADTGVGIAREDLPRLFERFYQAADTRKSHKGLGLGLDISKALVELHGGAIWAESERGYGSKFSFTLPLAARTGGEPAADSKDTLLA